MILDGILKAVEEVLNIILYNSYSVKSFGLALEKLGNAVSVDRVYIFENHTQLHSGDISTSQRLEWSKENIEPQIDNPELQNVSYDAMGITRWYDTLSQNGIISGLVQSFPLSERKILEPQGIISLLAVPIIIEEKFWGFIGFDDCHSKKVWSEVEISILRIAAAGIGAAVKRNQVELALKEAVENDFKLTVRNIHNLIFKYKRRDTGEFYYSLFEGKIAESFGKNTDNMYGKNLRDELPPEEASQLEAYLNRAFQGESISYELKYGTRTHYETLSPVIKDNVVVEVIGSSIDLTETKRAEEQIKNLAYYDTLTKLPNRILFRDRLNLGISHSKRNNEILSVMFIDLDRFKDINDTLGHDAGDELLKEVAIRLSNNIRKDDTISRMGGDEFALILGDMREEKQIVDIAEDIIDIFAKPFIIKGQEFYITASIGISAYPNDGDFSETLFKNAEIAMYRAKEFGKNNYQFFTQTMNEKAERRVELEKKLRKALEKNEFLLHYQPQVEAVTEKIVGCEALIRWDNEGFGLVSPGEFIPVAEETGLIIPMGEWVLNTACKQLKTWHEAGFSTLNMAVNVSAHQFEQTDFAEIVTKVIDETGVSPQHLEIELTESTMMKSTEQAISIMQKLRKKGVKISIDDFGTGFSSLGYLQKFSADILKIDRSFMGNIHGNSSNQAIVNAVIDMSHALNLCVVAEGVETKEQMDFLKTKGCDLIQGYYFSKPLPSNLFEKLLIDTYKVTK
jgi:diguanylate cyclase (GGDEF)-like protein